MKEWKCCAGYVNIGMVGKYPERLVNLCISNGIRMKKLERHDWGASSLVSASDFKRLHGLSRGCGVRIRILGRRGPNRFRAGLKRDAVFLTALLVMTALVLLASTRVWFIDIETVSIPEDEVRDRLSALGAFVGAAKRSFKTSELAGALDLDPRVVNARVKLEGVTLNVTLAETNASGGFAKEDGPSSIFADKDCVIRFISTASGRQRALAGQAVKRGDMLISGDLSDAKEGLFVRAEGLILGEVLYRAEATAGRGVERLGRTGASERLRTVCIFGFELKPRAPFHDYELEPVKTAGFTASLLPISIREYDCMELAVSEVMDTDGGTEERARLLAQERLMEMLPRDARILSVGTECRINGDGSVTAVITVTAVEEIGFRRELNGS